MMLSMKFDMIQSFGWKCITCCPYIYTVYLHTQTHIWRAVPKGNHKVQVQLNTLFLIVKSASVTQKSLYEFD